MKNNSSSSLNELDLRGTPCPVNFIKCRLALESLPDTELLHVDLDKGEPEATVITGLRAAGYRVEIISEDISWLTIKVSSGVR